MKLAGGILFLHVNQGDGRQGLQIGNLKGLRKDSFVERSEIATLDKRLPHFQTFGLEGVENEETGSKEYILLGVVRMRREMEKITMGVNCLLKTEVISQLPNLPLIVDR